MGTFYLHLPPLVVMYAQTKFFKTIFFSPKIIYMNKDTSRYEQRGVSSSKKEVHAAIAHLDKGLFPLAFCKVLPDFSGDPDYCQIMHADGAGTKVLLPYLAWKETDNLDIWRGVAQDSFVMNLDDMAAAGATGPFIITMSIDRNKALIPGEVIATIIDECDRLCKKFTSLGIPCHFAGGETADVGDLVRTIVINNTFHTRMKRSDIIDTSRITAPAYIVGFSSTGKMNWEEKINSGIGSNGLTDARHDVLSPYYQKYTEAFAPETPSELVYCGEHRLDESLPTSGEFSILSALSSPTQSYAPLIKELCRVVGREKILGFIHCSGGGQTKIGKFGAEKIVYIKSALFPIPPLFQFLKQTRNLSWEEAYKTYNMGHRMEAVVATEEDARACIAISQSSGVEAKIIGQVLSMPELPAKRTVVIQNEYGTVAAYTFE